MGKSLSITKEKIITDFGKLSTKNQKEVADFITFLRVKEELDETKNILSDTDFVDRIMKGEKDIKAGHLKKWSEVREDV